MTDPVLFDLLPASIGAVACPAGAFLRVGRRGLETGAVSGIVPAKLQRFLALFRPGLYWMEPRFGSTLDQVPAETQFLLWERDDRHYGVLIPLVDGDLRATLGGGNEGLSLVMDGCLPGTLPDSAMMAFAAVGSEPLALVHDAMVAIADRLRTFRLREQKPVPEFCNWLGWCTWDAFYHEVSEEKILEGLASFRRAGISPRFMILDDGWEQIDGDFLNAFEPNPAKFPHGLKHCIDCAKSQFGVRIFGIHHPFQGYWAGINPKGSLAGRYPLAGNMGNIRPWLGDKKQELNLVHPDHVHRFYSDFYNFLRGQGADMVKVDGQSALELFTEGVLGRVSTMKAYQEALQGAAAHHFQGQLIPCMSNGSDVALHLNSSNGWRNSTDYFPGKPAKVQKAHILVNAMNNVWSSTFAVPDWDMFQSHQPEAAFHAAARAISGGPIYVCDKPGMQNGALIKKLCLSDGRTLRCAAPAQPAADCLFVDCRRERRLLKIVNRNGSIGILGIFHCHDSDEPVTDRFSPSDVQGLTGQRVAVYLHNATTLSVLGHRARQTITLGSMTCEIATLSPITDGFAALGLLDKFNGSAAVCRFELQRGTAVCGLADGGRAGFYCCRKPGSVRVNGVAAKSRYDAATGLLAVGCRPGKPVTVEIRR